MTKSEFIAQFTEIIKDPANSLEKAATFLNEVSKDYDGFDTVNTTIENTKTTIDQLTAENKKLRETNMQLFTMFPTAKDEIVDIPDIDPTPDTPKPVEFTPDDISKMLLGKDINEGE